MDTDRYNRMARASDRTPDVGDTTPARIYVVESCGATGADPDYTIHMVREHAVSEADSLCRIGAQARVLSYEPKDVIFVSQGWCKR